MHKPRGWQIEALRKFQIAREKHFLLDATPGSGKTMFAGFAAADLLNRKQVDFGLIVVPNTTIKGDKDAGFLGDWSRLDVQITRVLKDKQPIPKEYRGAVITYQQLPNIVGTIGTWVRNGTRIFAVFDELHHASEDNTWGTATEDLGRLAIRILGMTGTCFRGDERPISFVRYDADNKAIADHQYKYRDAVSDHVCRPVDFITDDSMTQFMLDQNNHEVRVSEANTQEQLRGATSTVYRTDHGFLPRVIEKADDVLDQYRTWDRDAGGLIICRSGKDDSDNRHLFHVAELVYKTLGERPEVISYDDKDANAKIERFRKSDQRWICSVRKISEGVDIKRLRVVVMATRPTTELLFRQIVGRAVRVDDENRPGDATVLIAKFPQLVEWASVIAEEAKAGLKNPTKKPAGKGGEAPESRPFMSFGATHEAGGAVSDYGDEFSADEVNAAERLRGDDPQLADISITALAHLQRKLGIVPEPMTAPEPPLQIRKQEVRDGIVKKQRRLAIQRNPQSPDYGRVWKEIGGTFGPHTVDDLVNNYSIEVMRQVDAWLLATIARETHVK
jgi:superfamily II DNA or RNA helicase